ncbi:anti-sigma-F factor Fin family protein [Paenibacillus crassostreae]|uniref:anti-sigma-F factor Fin family protein n=1 Tax=Paenibacillus crassostreae TaxID=1763538 RepID=UPI0009EF4648|nr:anti-sigma-F factor Fin family protein [Paenibacillus crassostreae]
MAIKYICRHCQTVLGVIDSSMVSEFQLGFHSLTPSERQDIITYDLSGEVVVRVTCDYCTEAISTHPELSLLSSPLQ